MENKTRFMRQRKDLIQSDLLLPCYNFPLDKELCKQFKCACMAFLPDDMSVCKGEYNMLVVDEYGDIYAVKSIDFEDCSP